MKKTLLIGTFALLAMTSCKKDYTCECTTTVTQPAFVFGGIQIQSASTTKSTVSTTIKDKKDAAASKCASGTGTISTPSQYASAGATPTTAATVCAIK
ncbi:MAG: hypothetical protein WC044_09460 [Crocinitomicaceae bacterium]